MNIINLPLEEIVIADYDAVILDKQDVNQTMVQLKNFGLVEPALINVAKKRRNTLIFGHRYIEAARKLGYATYPCATVDLSLKEEKQLAVRMRKNTGRYDIPKLLKEFSSQELAEIGWNDQEIEAMSASITGQPVSGKSKVAYFYDLVFDTKQQVDEFRTKLSNITSQVRRTEQVKDLLNFLDGN